jgi:hypothetical protein
VKKTEHAPLEMLRDPKLITNSTLQCVSCKGPKNFITNPSQSTGLKTTGTVHICWPLFRTTGFTLWSRRGPLPWQHFILLALPMGKGQIFLFSKCHFQTFPYTIPCRWVHPSIRNLLLLSCVWTTSELPWWGSTLVVTYIVNPLLLPHTT